VSSAHHSRDTHTTDRAGTVCVCVCVCVCLWSLLDLPLRRDSAAANSFVRRRSTRLFIGRCPTLPPSSGCHANEPVSEICPSPLRSSSPELLLSSVARPQLPKHAPSPCPAPYRALMSRANPGFAAQAWISRVGSQSLSLPFLVRTAPLLLSVAGVPPPLAPRPSLRKPAPSPCSVPCLTPMGRANLGSVAQACLARVPLYSLSLPFLSVRLRESSIGATKGHNDALFIRLEGSRANARRLRESEHFQPSEQYENRYTEFGCVCG
jgi:hypothetical protein